MFEHFLFQPKAVSEMVADPNVKIVIDTNVLLAPYQWRKVTTQEVIKALKHLSDQHRLVIPEHVLREFSNRRPSLIVQMINSVDQEISRFQSPRDLKEIVPILSDLEEHQDGQELKRAYSRAGDAYKEKLKIFKESLKALFNDDHVLNEYGGILINSYYKPDPFPDMSTLETEAADRFKKKIPPGFKDAGKGENSAGDYIVWKQILSLNTDVIFVTLETKTDWAMTSQDMVITARHDLIMEFYEKTGGKSFQLISPLDFFPLVEPRLSEEVREDLKASITVTNKELVEENKKHDLLGTTIHVGSIDVEKLLTSRPNIRLTGNIRGLEHKNCENCGTASTTLIRGFCHRCNAIAAEDS